MAVICMFTFFFLGDTRDLYVPSHVRIWKKTLGRIPWRYMAGSKYPTEIKSW